MADTINENTVIHKEEDISWIDITVMLSSLDFSHQDCFKK